MHNFNPLAARLLSAALRADDLETAKEFALDLTDSEFLIQCRFEPGQSYTAVELADLIDSTLPQIESGKVDLVWGVYIPTVLGAVCNWLANDVLGEDDGKTDSQPS